MDITNSTPQKKAALLLPKEYAKSYLHWKDILTPNCNFCWKEWQYVINPTNGVFDAIVVLQSVRPLDQAITLTAPPTNTLMVVVEPPDILTLPDAYTKQFHTVLSQCPSMRCPNPLFAHSAHRWYVERPFAKILDTSDIEKTKMMSMIISSKKDTSGHRKRWQLACSLKEHFGSRLDWFGRGVQELKQKKEGVIPYRYHIVLENSAVPHYWTEKIVDAFVANAFPFYWGDPCLAEDFPADAFLSIDPDQTDKCIQTIEKALDDNLYEQRQSALHESRRRIVEEYHPYEVYRRIWENTLPSKPEEITIQPHSNFSFSFRQKMNFRKNNLLKKLRL